MEIIHLGQKEIDKKKWDQAISLVPGGSLYGQSWYLDAVCPDWQALVTSDYSMIMPLTARRKFGFQYLYQPLLSQQLGIFSKAIIKPVDVDAFLKAIPPAFKLIEITLNDRNPAGTVFPVKNHVTCRLALNQSYPQIQEKYTENTRRNLKKVASESIRFRTNITPAEFLSLLQSDKSAGSRILINKKNQPALMRLMSAILNRKAGMICGIKDRHDHLLAAALIGQNKGFHYYLAPAQSAEGRDARAMFFLIDRYIHLHSGLPATLDFEGSDIHSVARFYKGFGATPSTYTSLIINRLPWPLNHWANHRTK